MPSFLTIDMAFMLLASVPFLSRINLGSGPPLALSPTHSCKRSITGPSGDFPTVGSQNWRDLMPWRGVFPIHVIYHLPLPVILASCRDCSGHHPPVPEPLLLAIFSSFCPDLNHKGPS